VRNIVVRGEAQVRHRLAKPCKGVGDRANDQVRLIGWNFAGTLTDYFNKCWCRNDLYDEFVIERKCHAERVEARPKVCRSGGNLDRYATTEF
jgi:hypothetical protein